MKDRTLIIGYGNAYCHDDGVGLYVINQLRNRLGLRELQPDEDGIDEVGYGLDTIMVHQLIPEIIPVLADYPAVIFVDAHMGVIPDDVRVVPVEEERRFHAVTHHMSPGMILSMVRDMKGKAPSGYLVSVRGEDFDFGLGITEVCRRRADLAVEKILDLLDSAGCEREK
jgi:hydrogenase maturation protease